MFILIKDESAYFSISREGAGIGIPPCKQELGGDASLNGPSPWLGPRGLRRSVIGIVSEGTLGISVP